MVPDWAIRTEADRQAIKEGCFWSDAHANRIVTFTEKFFRSQFIKGKVTLRENQKRFLQSLYGWRLPDGRRRFRFANLHVPKKSFGKTLLVSVIAFFELFASGEPSPVVVSAAASRDNASQVFKELKYAVERSPFKSFTRIKTHTKELAVADTNASFQSLASDGNRLHGINASTVILDELHAHRSPELFQALRYATDARPNGLVVCISTAGSDVTHFYHGIYAKSKRVLDGKDLDITHYAEVYEADPDKPFDDPEQWKAANPNLGCPEFPLDQFARDFKAAKSGDITEYLNFLRLKLNVWIAASDLAFFDVTRFEDYRDDPDDQELARVPCAVGVDLSETVDPSSITAIWLLEPGRYYVRSWAWVASEGVKLREQTQLPKYQGFSAEGSLTITAGDRIDDRAVLAHVLDLCKRNNVVAVNFDPRSAYTMGARVEEEGYPTARVPQSFRYFSPVMKEFKKAFEEGRVTHNGSTWLRYCLANVRIETNRYDEIRPVRKRSVDKIDGAVSTLLAFLGLLTSKDNTVSEGIILV